MKKKEILEHAFDSIINKKQDYIKTGFGDIDSILSGTEKGSLIIIGGRPAMGKTALMMSILENLLKLGKKCLYISLDMNSVQVVQKLIIQCAEIDTCRVKNGKLNELEWKKFANVMKEIENWELGISENANIDEIEKEIKNYKPEYIFLDYLQLLDTPLLKPRNDELSEILRSLKNIAKENHVFIFIASQLSRKIEKRADKRPLLCDLKGTDVIEEIADVVMFIYRKEYYIQYNSDEINPYNKGETEIIIAKNSYGIPDITRLKFESSYCKFKDLGLRFDSF